MHWDPIAQLAKDNRQGKRKVSDLVWDCLRQIKKADNYHAILETSPTAHEYARELDKIPVKDRKGKLFGVPFIVKDNFLTTNTHTTAGSNILKPFRAPYQATAVERLEAEGAIMVAKSNLDAFAHGSSTENSDFGPTKNPRNLAYVPGGSSGGSAAAIALGQAAFALGTDTGGSIRLPASFSGVVGLKVTYGLVSRYGVIAMASSTDTIGPLTRSVDDAALVLDVMSGQDEHDGTSIPRDGSGYQRLSANLKGKRVAVIKEHFGPGVDPNVANRIKEVVSTMEAAGAIVTEVSIPIDELALAVYYILVPAEVSSNLARYDGIKYGFSAKQAGSLVELYERSRAEGFGDEAKRRIMVGTYVLSSGYYDAYYKKAQAVRTILIEEYQKAFAQADILVGPTAPTLPFKLGARRDPLSMYLTDVLTVAANLVGNPAISVPVGMVDGLPVGMQLSAPQRAERTLLGVARAVEGLVK
ncbi:Asp-tRNA(Asn)/Glu-tRNA(Gln) amidotransferase subunit GatA [Candidatus Microgenomates bacterium]|nr:Asp-tRNA(Asn)/Glu-tRNA(Gln) amidotransferase subunit GatA [Candidatus Microgenomates bacterium]